jgi:eukaryotic-like serine/threonine-protein kinase
VKVTDFGIARAASSTTLTRTGVVLGSVYYMSPEQALGESVGAGSDLYSLGVVLYQMLTGRYPYEAENPLEVVMKHVNGQLRSPDEVNHEVPENISLLTLKLLAKAPADRYPSAADLVQDLLRVKTGASLTPTHLKPSRRIETKRQKTKPEKAPTPPDTTKDKPHSGFANELGELLPGWFLSWRSLPC